MEPHPYWINAGARNVRETTDSAAKGFHFKRRRRLWTNEMLWLALTILLIAIHLAT